MRTRSALLGVMLVVASGCFGRSELDIASADAGSDVDLDAYVAPPAIAQATKIDLLFVVDDSSSTDVEHTLLAQTIPYLVDRFATPACVNGFGSVDPMPGNGPCTYGQREFLPIEDVHIGVISTSLGGHGADVCSPSDPNWNPTQNDAAHLLTRGQGNAVVPTYQSLGFLAWDPAQKENPPGEDDAQALAAKVGTIMEGTGSIGCGFESQLESIYRFLNDPNPYQSITVQAGTAVASGTDSVLLQERADFLRPDSLVVVILVTDENDCSTQENGQFYISNQSTNGASDYHLPRGRSECATNPNSPCCASCAQQTPAGCSPTASDSECVKGNYDDAGDPLNLRCFDQKRRFGADFLYPVDRYIGGFTRDTVVDRDGNQRVNPLLVGGRSPSLVLFAGIVGVPWQDVANDPTDLTSGYAPANAINWAAIVGDPTHGAAPSDPLMIESIDPRTGTNPATGDALAPPTASTALANPINGHERTITNRDDLQPACIFALPTPIDCAVAACPCEPPNVDTNPLCQQTDGTYSTSERYWRAQPATRELEVLEGIGDQAIVASVCASTVVDPTQPTFGYKQAIDAVLRSVKEHVPRANP